MQLDQSWPAHRDAVAPIRHAVGDFADTVGATARASQAIALAVSEAATNVVLHAYLDHDGGGEIKVLAFIEGRTLRIVIRDHGRGMTPRRDSPGLGLGLPLIAQLADEVRIGSTNGSGTEIQMDFALDA
jgi:anti-sigma regulatory factor (Ser/Thr protein kinase)